MVRNYLNSVYQNLGGSSECKVPINLFFQLSGKRVQCVQSVIDYRLKSVYPNNLH